MNNTRHASIILLPCNLLRRLCSCLNLEDSFPEAGARSVGLQSLELQERKHYRLTIIFLAGTKRYLLLTLGHTSYLWKSSTKARSDTSLAKGSTHSSRRYPRPSTLTSPSPRWASSLLTCGELQLAQFTCVIRWSWQGSTLPQFHHKLELCQCLSAGSLSTSQCTAWSTGDCRHGSRNVRGFVFFCSRLTRTKFTPRSNSAGQESHTSFTCTTQ